LISLAEQGFIAFRDNGAENKKCLDFKFGKQTITPAPFYLVWPKKGLDEWCYPWPFQLVSLSLEPAETYFGAAAPAASTNAQVNKGFSYSIVIVYVVIPLTFPVAKPALNLIYPKTLPNTLRNRICQILYLMPMRTVPAPKCPILKASLPLMMRKISCIT
jgi:hypothetical protein